VRSWKREIGADVAELSEEIPAKHASSGRRGQSRHFENSSAKKRAASLSYPAAKTNIPATKIFKNASSRFLNPHGVPSGKLRRVGSAKLNNASGFVTFSKFSSGQLRLLKPRVRT